LLIGSATCWSGAARGCCPGAGVDPSPGDFENKVPFDRLSDFLAELGKWLIVEFVPKADSQVQ